MMSYRALSKLYYEDKETYRHVYETRFHSQDTIKMDFRIKGNQAFFVQNADVSNTIFQILKTDKNISMLSSQLPSAALEQYKKRCLIDEIVLTNKIEGVFSTRREITSILSDLEKSVNEKTTRKRFWGLVNQYVKLIANKSVSLQNSEDIRQLYNELILAEVIEENPGNAPDGKLFRRDSTSVNTSTEKEIHRGTFPESAIIEEVEKSLAFLNDVSIYPLYRILIFHYLLEYIHPFYDGNGRLGRYIVSALLSKELDPLLAYRISYTILENINLYYNAFKVCNDPHNLGDVTPFLLMMLNMVNTSSKKLEEALIKRKIRLTNYKQIIPTLPGGTKERTYNTYLYLIQAGLFSENGISTRGLECYLRNSYTTIKKELEFIDSYHLLTKTRVGKENYYLIDLEKLDYIILSKNTST